MRCPRCNSHVMPGVENCFSCGADLSRPVEKERTLPSVVRGNDLLSQRRSARRERNWGKLERRWDRATAAVLRVRPSFVLMIPPFWIAWESWVLGLWFFRRRRWRDGAIAAGVLLTVFYATIIDSSARGNLSWSWPFLILALVGIAVYAAWIRFVELRIANEPRVLLLSLATAITGLGLLYATVAFAQTAWFNEATLRNLNADVTFPGGTVKQGAMIMANPSRPGELQGGDIAFIFSTPYRVVAVAGEEIEIRNCMLLVDGETAPAYRDPVYQVWHPGMCANDIAPQTIEQGKWATLIPRWADDQIEWRVSQRSWNSADQRAAYVIWPPGQWRRL